MITFGRRFEGKGKALRSSISTKNEMKPQALRIQQFLTVSDNDNGTLGTDFRIETDEEIATEAPFEINTKHGKITVEVDVSPSGRGDGQTEVK
jgi:hypothetical protein